MNRLHIEMYIQCTNKSFNNFNFFFLDQGRVQISISLFTDPMNHLFGSLWCLNVTLYREDWVLMKMCVIYPCLFSMFAFFQEWSERKFSREVPSFLRRFYPIVGEFSGDVYPSPFLRLEPPPTRNFVIVSARCCCQNKYFLL